MRKILVFILFVSNILYASKVIELPNLNKPNLIAIDNNQTFIVDGSNIFIFSLNDFKLINKFGKRGEGPGEFLNKYVNLQILPDGILISDKNKILLFSKNGNFRKEIRIPPFMSIVKKIGNNYISFKWDISQKSNDIYISYNLYDSNFKKLIELYRGKAMIHKNRTRDVFEIFFYDVVESKIILAHRKGFFLDIFDTDGNKLNSITRNNKPIPFGKEDKDEIVSYWNSQPNYKGFYEIMKKRLNFPKFYPDIYQCRKSKNLIYIITYLKKENKRECYVYNNNGEYLKKIFLPLKIKSPVDLGIFTIHNNKLYQLVEDIDNEIWRLHIYDLK